MVLSGGSVRLRGIRSPVAFNGIALHQTTVTGIAAVVVRGIGIQDFTPLAGLVNPEAIMMARYRGKVAGDDNFVAGFIPSHKDKHRALMVIHHQPLETVRVKIKLMQGFVVTVGQVQVPHQTLYAVVPVVAPFQQMPVEAGVVVPLAPWANSLPINSSFLPGKANIQP